MTRAEALAAGFIDSPEGPGPAPEPKTMSRADALAQGFVDEPDEPEQPKVAPETLKDGTNHGPGTAFGVNALDSASLIGIPTTMALADTLKGIDSGASSRSIGPTPNFKDLPFKERYYRNKEFYAGGMDRLRGTNPKASFAGQVAPAVLTPGGAALKGAKALKVIGVAGAEGVARGVLGGQAHTLGGDLEGTAGDGLAEGLVSAGTAGLVHGGGKLVEAGGNAARGGMAKVMSKVRDLTASDIGKFSKKSGEGVGAIENLWNRRGMIRDANAAQLGAGKPVGVPGAQALGLTQQARLLDKRGANAVRAAGVEDALVKKYGALGRPSTRELNAKNFEKVRDSATQHIWGVAKGAAMGGAGYAAADAAGLDPRIGAAIAGSGGIYALRKASQAVMQHPDTLQKLMKLAPVGRALASGAGRGKNVGAVIYALAQKHPEVRAAVLSEYKDPADIREEDDR